MYAPFFGLEQPPFSIAPDPRYLFMSERHREALAHLLYGLDAGGGFVLLTGEIGTGKTTICRCFLEQIPAHCQIAYIFNPRLSVPELLRSICDEFGVQRPPARADGETVKDCIDPLNDFLLRAHAAGRSCVLVIDEAQNLQPDVLEQLRLLTNLETSEKKLLQIILIGQPELRDMVAQPQLQQLAQRVIARYHLGALERSETMQYLAHRLAVAGLRGPLPFDSRALAQIHALSGGIPRRINLLCDRALLGAYGAGQRQVSLATLRQAAREVFGPNQARAPMPRWLLASVSAAAGMAVALAATLWALGRWPLAQGHATAPAAPAARSAPALAQASAQPAALAQWLAAQPAAAAGEAAGWSLLAQAWEAPLAAGQGAEACASLASQGLRCFRTRRASLALLRLIDRPVLLTLQAPDSGRERVLALHTLDGDRATLIGADGQRWTLPLAELAPLWHGDIATLWRAAPELPASGDITASRAGAAWLDQRLAQAGPGGTDRANNANNAKRTDSAARRARIHQFQLAQGLTPDGQAGPLTLMLLNRATGVPEPRLQPSTGP